MLLGLSPSFPFVPFLGSWVGQFLSSFASTRMSFYHYVRALRGRLGIVYANPFSNQTGVRIKRLMFLPAWDAAQSRMYCTYYLAVLIHKLYMYAFSSFQVVLETFFWIVSFWLFPQNTRDAYKLAATKGMVLNATYKDATVSRCIDWTSNWTRLYFHRLWALVLLLRFPNFSLVHHSFRYRGLCYHSYPRLLTLTTKFPNANKEVDSDNGSLILPGHLYEIKSHNPPNSSRHVYSSSEPPGT